MYAQYSIHLLVKSFILFFTFSRVPFYSFHVEQSFFYGIFLHNSRYKPVPHDDLVAAFRALDKEKKGTLEPAKLKEMLMKEGESFTAEEVEEMFNFAVNKGDSLIHWEEYVDKLYRMLKIGN